MRIKTAFDRYVEEQLRNPRARRQYERTLAEIRRRDVKTLTRGRTSGVKKQ